MLTYNQGLLLIWTLAIVVMVAVGWGAPFVAHVLRYRAYMRKYPRAPKDKVWLYTRENHRGS